MKPAPWPALVPADRLAQIAGNQRAGNAQHGRQDEAQLLLAGHDRPGDQTDDEPDDDGPDDRHGASLDVELT